MARADLAMRAAKQGGRNRVQFYDNMDNDTRKKLRDTDNYTSLIEEGLRNNNFYPVFQPIFDVPSGEVVGYETLARIRGHGNGPNESIGNVIAAAERYGFAVDVNRRIISMVADMLDSNTTWLQGKLLSFNFSAQSIGDAQIIDTIKRLTSTSVPPGSLIFEITETAALTSLPATQAFLKELSALGCLSAPDDFGSGYSSFTYLRELSVNFITLDREYVRGIHHDPLEMAIGHKDTDMKVEIEAYFCKIICAAMRGAPIQEIQKFWQTLKTRLAQVAPKIRKLQTIQDS